MNLLDYILGKRYVESQISQIKPEEKTVTPTKSQQIITPTTGKYLSKVTVNTIQYLVAILFQVELWKLLKMVHIM